METKTLKTLVRITFLLLSLSCATAIVEFYTEIFPALKTGYHFNLLHLSGIADIPSGMPVKPVVLMIVTIILCMVFIKILYRAVISKIQRG